MDIFGEMQKYGHEELNFLYEREFGLNGIVAVHNSNPGIALGPTKAGTYLLEEEAISDALRLSRGTTLSASMLNCDIGGAAGILIQDEGHQNTEGYLRTYGRFLKSFGDGFCTLSETGLVEKDMFFVAKEFPHVIGLPEFCGGLGEPYYYIAYGAYHCIKACVNEVFGNPSLDRKKFLVCGLTPAGIHLVKLLSQEGAAISVTDDHYDNVKRLRDEIPTVSIVRPEEWADIDVDVFSPCASGGIITKKYLEAKKCRIIAGIARSPFETDDLSEIAMKNGIIYAPDFVMNSAEAVFADSELSGYDAENVRHHIEQIYDVMSDILSRSKETAAATDAVAESMCVERLDVIRKVRKIYAGSRKNEVR